MPTLDDVAAPSQRFSTDVILGRTPLSDGSWWTLVPRMLLRFVLVVGTRGVWFRESPAYVRIWDREQDASAYISCKDPQEAERAKAAIEADLAVMEPAVFSRVYELEGSSRGTEFRRMSGKRRVLVIGASVLLITIALLILGLVGEDADRSRTVGGVVMAVVLLFLGVAAVPRLIASRRDRWPHDG